MFPSEKSSSLSRLEIITGNERLFVYFYDAKTGTVKALPKKTSGIGFTRPSLVSCLEQAAIECPKITIERGAAAVSFQEVDNDLQVTMEDGKSVSATHVIGADGKWSQVRQSFLSL